MARFAALIWRVARAQWPTEGNGGLGLIPAITEMRMLGKPMRARILPMVDLVWLADADAPEWPEFADLVAKFWSEVIPGERPIPVSEFRAEVLFAPRRAFTSSDRFSASAENAAERWSKRYAPTLYSGRKQSRYCPAGSSQLAHYVGMPRIRGLRVDEVNCGSVFARSPTGQGTKRCEEVLMHRFGVVVMSFVLAVIFALIVIGGRRGLNSAQLASAWPM